MIRIATVFSGIGAFEQAIERMGIEHEIVFACDNGNIAIDINYEEEYKKIKKIKKARKMKKIIEKKIYVDNLYKRKSRKTNFIKKTYNANYIIKDDNFFYDIKLLDGRDFKNKVDILVGGSPCQSFSAIGERKGLEAASGTLFYDFGRLVNEVKPKVFIYENVFGILTHDNGKTWETMKSVFNESNYFYKYQILNSKDYGVPQSRRRLFVVGFLKKKYYKKFSFPKKKKLKYYLKDILLENCKRGSFQSIDGEIVIKNNKGEKINERYYLSEKLKKYVLSPGTKKFYHPNAKIDKPIARALLSTMGNSHRASVNNYVTTNNKIRALHPRETLRLMGFPDSFKNIQSKSRMYMQVGNSIVVDVLIELMKEIRKTEVL